MKKKNEYRFMPRKEHLDHSREKNDSGDFFEEPVLKAMNEYPIFQDHIDLVFRIYTWAFKQGYGQCWHDNGLCNDWDGE